MTKTAINIGATVGPREGCTWSGHHTGKVLDLFHDADGTKMAEVRWNDGANGAWPVSELVSK